MSASCLCGCCFGHFADCPHQQTVVRRSWVSLHNSLAFTQILLYCCKGFLWWPLQLQTKFQFTTLNGCGITGCGIFIHKFDCIILTQAGFCVTSPCDSSKRHSYNGYSIYMPNFNQFLPVVYPVGMTVIKVHLHTNFGWNVMKTYRVMINISCLKRLKIWAFYVYQVLAW